MKFINSLCAAAILATSPVSAATISEGFGADFGPDVPSAFPGGLLDLGHNSITGNLSRDRGSADLSDTVEFSVAVGQELVDASFLPFNSGFFDLEATIRDASGVKIVSQAFGPFGGGTFLNGNILGAGTYYFQATALEFFGETFDAGYSVGLTTREAATTPPPNVVPLPASAPLVLGGLALFGAMGWRKKRSA